MSKIINLELGLIDGTVSPVLLCFSVLKSSETTLAPERSTGYLCYCSIQDSCLLSGDKDRNLSNSASLVPAYRIQIAIATLIFNQDFGLWENHSNPFLLQLFLNHRILYVQKIVDLGFPIKETLPKAHRIWGLSVLWDQSNFFFGHITSSYSNLDQISSSESPSSVNFKISTRHQHLD